MNSARLLLAVLLSLGSVTLLAACGEEEQPAQENQQYQSVNAQLAETEGIYLDIEGIKYQVQVSRQLNQFLVDDQSYLAGLSESERELAADEEWFAVFLQADNVSEEALPNVSDFEMRDTQENVYRPVRLPPENIWAYEPTVIPAGERYPPLNSPAGERPPYATVLLFKVRRFSLDNRPLELTLTGREGEQAIVNLDV